MIYLDPLLIKDANGTDWQPIKVDIDLTTTDKRFFEARNLVLNRDFQNDLAITHWARDIFFKNCTTRYTISNKFDRRVDEHILPSQEARKNLELLSEQTDTHELGKRISMIVYRPSIFNQKNGIVLFKAKDLAAYEAKLILDESINRFEKTR